MRGALRLAACLGLMALVSVMLAAPARAATGLAMVCTDASAAGKPVNASCGSYAQTGQVYKVPASGDLVRIAAKPISGDYWASTDYQWAAWDSVQPGQSYDTCTTDVVPGALVTGGTCTAWGFTPRTIVSSTGTVTLTWTAPTANTDGSPLTDLAGFNVYRGSSATNLVKLVPALGPGVTSFQDALPAGTFYYTLTAFTASAESDKPAPISVTVTKIATKPGQPSQLRVTVTVRGVP